MAITNWKEAEKAVRDFAAKYGVTKIYWGTGRPIETPHAVASSLDAWSGEGMGYFVRVYPQGDHGYMSKAPYYSTTIRIQ